MPGGGRRRRRPPPTPPPPASLVKLLSKDKQVLRYFQALQANLEADVQIWKDRATEWQRQVEELQELKSKKTSHSSRTGKGNKKTHAKETSSDEVEEDKDDNHKSHDMDDDSSVDESHDNNHNGKRQTKQSTKKTAAAKKHNKKPPPDEKKDNAAEDDESDNPVHPKRKRQKPSEDTSKTAKAVAASSSRQTKSPSTSREDSPRPHAAFALQSDSDDNDDDGDNDSNLQDMHQQNSQGFASVSSKPNWGIPAQNNPVFGLESEDEKEQDSKPAAQSIDDLSYPSDSSEEEENDKDIAADDAAPAKGNPSSLDRLAMESASDNESDSDELSLFDDKSSKKPILDAKTQSFIDELLAALDELGIESVHPETKERRTNEEMQTDFRFALQSLCRVTLTDHDMLETFPPFDNQGKSAPGQEHPARLGLRFIFRSIILLESYGDLCPRRHCLNGRIGMISQLEKTLRKEIQQGWAVTDRAARCHPRGGPHFLPQEQQDGGVSDGNVSVKSLPKLCHLLERSYWARILVGLSISRNDMSSAVTVVQEYIVATAPCVSKEDALHPKHAPALSFVILEAMVKPCMQEMGWGEKGGQVEVELYSRLWGQETATASSDVYATCCHYTANIWKQRASSGLDQIRHVAQIECAAYQRLCNECGLPSGRRVTCDAEGLGRLLESLEDRLDSKDTIAAYRLCLVLRGSLDVSNLVWNPEKDLDWNRNRLVCWCGAIRQIYLRGLEEAAISVGSKAALNCPADSLVDDCREQFGWLWDLNPFESDLDKACVLGTLIDCAASLADGDSVIRYSHQLIDLLGKMNSFDCERQSLRSVWDVLRDVSRRPVARVINLQRRHDRWKHMLSQAMAQEFLIVRGLGDFRVKEGNGEGNLTHGGCALNGEWPSSKLYELVGSPAQVANLIQRDWRPLDLAPFDKDAPRTENTVSMHPSEVACALSHIACWKASSRAFDLLSSPTASLRNTGLLRQADLLRRNIQLAGFASGPPLRPQNNGMYPTPVCLVMEDDATVVDDFVEALEDLLTQLPRDFHYCSIGYARPKSAPILSPWSSRPRIGVPTHLFFATAYVVSPSGLAYMEDHGPVEGPIDAWLGLRQTHNFDNLIGERLGVGSHGKGGEFTADQASTILDFQAYCALPPLCSQRLRNSNHPPGKGRRWKDKDTDIIYSGHM